MSLKISAWVEYKGDHFVATRLQAPVVSAVGATREEAVAGLAAAVASHSGRGEWVTLDWPAPDSGVPTIVPPRPWPPTPEEEELHREFMAEIYRQREEDTRREFGE